ncbi:hypothetical protein GVAV_001206 [Gurleya vavrai]
MNFFTNFGSLVSDLDNFGNINNSACPSNKTGKSYINYDEKKNFKERGMSNKNNFLSTQRLNKRDIRSLNRYEIKGTANTNQEINSINPESFTEQNNGTKAYLDIILKIKKCIFKFFSFYESRKEKNRYVDIENIALEKYKKNSNLNRILNSVVNNTDYKEYEFIAFNYDYKYVVKLVKTPFNYFDKSIYRSKSHKANILIKQDYKNIAFYKIKHRINIEICFNDNINFIISLAYTKQAIDNIKKLNITQNGNFDFKDLSFLFEIDKMYDDCYLIKGPYNLGLALNENHVTLGLPKASNPDQYDLFLKHTPDSFCYDGNNDVIFKQNFDQLQISALQFMSIVFEIYKPFVFLSNLDFEDFINMPALSKKNFIPFFRKIFELNFDITVKADKYLFNDSKCYFAELIEASNVKDKIKFEKKSNEKIEIEKIIENMDSWIVNSKDFNIHDYYKNLYGISPNFKSYSNEEIEDTILSLNPNFLNKDKVYDQLVNVIIFKSFENVTFFKNKERLVVKIYFSLNKKHIIVSGPFSENALNNLKECGISSDYRAFNRLEFISCIFGPSDDVFLESKNVYLKFSLTKSIIRFGYSHVKNDLQLDKFYKSLIFKECLKNQTDVLFAYDLGDISKMKTIYSYLFYTFNPFIFHTVDMFRMHINESDINEFNLYDIYTSIYYRYLNISVKYEKNLDFINLGQKEINSKQNQKI